MYVMGRLPHGDIQHSTQSTPFESELVESAAVAASVPASVTELCQAAAALGPVLVSEAAAVRDRGSLLLEGWGFAGWCCHLLQ